MYNNNINVVKCANNALTKKRKCVVKTEKINVSKITKWSFKISKEVKQSNINKMVDVILTQFLQTTNARDVSMKKKWTQICKCLLSRTNDLSKAVITNWLKQYKGDERLCSWLQKAMVKLTNPKIESNTKKKCEKFIADMFAVMIKTELFKIGWKSRVNYWISLAVLLTTLVWIPMSLNGQAMQSIVCG